MITGYLACDGTAVARSSYPGLFARIGTTFNTGGETAAQFRLPNLSNRTTVCIGSDSNRFVTAGRSFGEYGGAETHTLTVAELPLHSHTGTTGNQSATHIHTASLDSQLNNTAGVSMDTHTHQYIYTPWTGDSDAGGGKAAQNGNAWTTSGNGPSLQHTHTYTTSTPDAQHNHTYTTNTGDSLGGGAHNNIQPSLVGAFYIKI